MALPDLEFWAFLAVAGPGLFLPVVITWWRERTVVPVALLSLVFWPGALMKTLALAAALTFAVTGAALAQMSAGGGSAQSNMNNPGSVKSSSQKRMGGRRGMMAMRHMSRHRPHHIRRSRM